MGFTVVLSSDGTEQGCVQFHTLLVMKDTDYRCQPEGILTHEQVEELSGELRHLPAVGHGRIGRYKWEEKQLVGS